MHINRWKRVNTWSHDWGSGLVTMGYSSYIYMPITGIILILAVIINKYITGEGILGQGYGGSNKIT